MIQDKKNKIHNQILLLIISEEYYSISQIHEMIQNDTSLITTKRVVSQMTDVGLLYKSGKGRSVKYQISNLGRINLNINPEKYCEVEVDKRVGFEKFNFTILDSLLSVDILSKEEIHILENTTSEYQKKIKDASTTVHKKELERFIIELSWKSSKIEGNTYTLLDTERLLKDGIFAKGKTKEDGIMIINHKNAFDFIYNNQNLFKNINISKIEEVHKLLIKDLNVTNNLRSKPVGILGSKYRPLDNQFQIREVLEKLCEIINKEKSPYGKALLTILGISYIQPFEDGNKRTSRLVGNAVLLAHALAPLSYRIVDEEKYREAILVFYEINSIIPFKNIFTEQYIFSAQNYLI